MDAMGLVGAAYSHGYDAVLSVLMQEVTSISMDVDHCYHMQLLPYAIHSKVDRIYNIFSLAVSRASLSAITTATPLCALIIVQVDNRILPLTSAIHHQSSI
jgi:hypothetical protein